MPTTHEQKSIQALPADKYSVGDEEWTAFAPSVKSILNEIEFDDADDRHIRRY